MAGAVSSSRRKNGKLKSSFLLKYIYTQIKSFFAGYFEFVLECEVWNREIVGSAQISFKMYPRQVIDTFESFLNFRLSQTTPSPNSFC